MKVLVHQADKTAGIKEVQIPALDDCDVLIRTVAAALNPTDWAVGKYAYHLIYFYLLRLTNLP